MALQVPHNARELAPVDAYLTDGQRLIVILEVDRSGALGEDVKSELLVSIEASEICEPGEECKPGRWRRVTPAQDAA